MSQIPITKDYADAVGRWCEKVGDRSLLLEKLALPKNWNADIKEDAASSWSLMRIASNGPDLLEQIARKLEHPGPNVAEPKRSNMIESGKVARALKNTRVDSMDHLRSSHTESFLKLLHAAYPEQRLKIIYARLEGRLAINLADGIIQNAGISLDRIFGLPLIPGSAIKGVARHAAWCDVQENPDPEKKKLLNRVFGADDQSCQGAVTFLQATPTNDAKIVVDITNVHTPKYYRTGKISDLREEKPTPNTFPAVERGAEFAFPIVLNGLDPDETLLEAAGKWLVTALSISGIGAKTGAGYGWFSILGETSSSVEKQTENVQANVEIVEQLKNLSAQELAALANRFKHGTEYFPKEGEASDLIFQRSLLDVLTGLPNPTAGQKKAIANLKKEFHLT